MHSEELSAIDLRAVGGGAMPISLSADASFLGSVPGENQILGGSLLLQGEVLRMNEGRYQLRYSLTADLEVECCRCLDPVGYQIALDDEVAILLTDLLPDGEGDGDTLYVSADTMQLDLWGYIRETLALALPMRIYHGMESVTAGECNPDMVGRISSELPESGGAGEATGSLADALRVAMESSDKVR